MGTPLLIGGTAEERLAAGYGLVTTDRVHPPLGNPLLAAPGLSRFLADRPGAHTLHAWTWRALVVALKVARAIPKGARPNVCCTLSGAPPLWLGRLGARAIAKADEVAFTSIAAREAWARLLDFSRSGYPVHRPSVPAGAINPADRETIRREWEIEPGVVVIWGGGDDLDAVEARRLAYHVGVMNIAGTRAVGVCSSKASQLERALRFTTDHNSPWRLIFDDRPVPRLLPACDVALCLGDLEEVCIGDGAQRRLPRAGDLCVDWARAAGLRIVSPAQEARAVTVNTQLHAACA